MAGAFQPRLDLGQFPRDQHVRARQDVPRALQGYEASRRPVVDKLVAAAERSADWYEHFAEHMQLDPWDLAWSYIQRSGRVSLDKLRQVSPRFVAGYESHKR